MNIDDKVISGAAEAVDMDPGVLQKTLKELPQAMMDFAITVILSAIFLAVGLWLIKRLRVFTKAAMTKANCDKGLIQFIDSLLKISLTALLVLLVAIRFGLQAATVVTMLGSVGVAFALALQGSLANCAGGVLILLQKLYAVGDYIVDAAGNEGTVKEISLFYTTLLTLDGKIITLPNGALANGRITNFTATETRMIELFFPIDYRADVQLARKVILDIVNESEKIHKDLEIRVFISELTDSAVVMSLWCWTDNLSYKYEKSELTEKIKLAFDREGINIPFPQMDVHVKK